MELKQKRARILNYPVDLVNFEQGISFIEEKISSQQGAQVVTINPEMIAQGDKNVELGNALKEADLVLPDGIGVIIGLKTLGVNTLQIPGIEFSEKLIKLASEKNYKVAFIGAGKEVVNEAASNMQKKYVNLNIVFVNDGYFTDEDEADILEKLKEVNPDILFVALGVPRQELWIKKYKKILNRTIMVGVGGSFDVWANKVKRAPAIFRKLGCEWLFRLMSQPSRFKRMFPTLPLFLLKVLVEREKSGKEF